MNKISITGLLVGAALAVTSVASAENTGYFKIAKLEGSSGSVDGYRVYPADITLPSVGCSKNDFAEVGSAGSVGGDRHKMSRLLLAAFTAGRKVHLWVEGCGPTGRPAYRIVVMDSDL